VSKLTFAERAWEEYLYWQEKDKRTLKRVNLPLKDIARNGNDGIGKPEPLRRRDASAQNPHTAIDRGERHGIYLNM
jgi:Txe/YoeB family toxin of Txe-Axe toxin-antitoxin module